MKNNIAALVVGLIFSVGLGVSGMTNPQKVLSFLDVTGNWDPSLAFVMVGAIGFHLVTYRVIRRRQLPLYCSEWHVPKNNKITLSLILGSMIFGAGWGLAGYCPGPALTSLASLQLSPMIFVAGMIVGMLVFKGIDIKIGIKR